MSEPARNFDRTPWQLRIFSKSLKKRQKLDLLLRMAGPQTDDRCLLLTCGDNNGALNYHFRTAGGRWTWADLEAGGIEEMESFLGETVHDVRPDRLPFERGSFDLVVVIDVHEHLDDVESLNSELARVLLSGGRAVVTTPNGNPRLPLARAKRWIGMTPAVYGHVVQGYSLDELESMLERVGLCPERRGAYSRFFTEAVELAINFAYVRLLSSRATGGTEQAPIAPDTEERLRGVEKTYRVYSRFFPLIRLIASLDKLLPGSGGYAVAVAASKPR
jgi:SAM-dependent methyltransferase